MQSGAAGRLQKGGAFQHIRAKNWWWCSVCKFASGNVSCFKTRPCALDAGIQSRSKRAETIAKCERAKVFAAKNMCGAKRDDWLKELQRAMEILAAGNGRKDQ